MTGSVLKQDPNTEGSTERDLLGQNTTCEFSGQSPLSSYTIIVVLLCMLCVLAVNGS